MKKRKTAKNSKKEKILIGISITCSIITSIIPLYFLILGLGSLGASGLAVLGTAFILPSAFALAISVLDLLITKDIITGKRGLVYSYICAIIKVIIIIDLVIIPLIHNAQYISQFNSLNVGMSLAEIVILAIFTFPSIFNIIRLSTPKKKNNKKWSR